MTEILDLTRVALEAPPLAVALLTLGGLIGAFAVVKFFHLVKLSDRSNNRKAVVMTSPELEYLGRRVDDLSRELRHHLDSYEAHVKETQNQAVQFARISVAVEHMVKLQELISRKMDETLERLHQNQERDHGRIGKLEDECIRLKAALDIG